MMYFLLILFFGSLTGITFMIGRKLVLIQSGQAPHIHHEGGSFFKTEYWEEFRSAVIKNTKRYGYVALVATIRFYFRSSNTVKAKYREARSKVIEMRRKNSGSIETEKREVSKFLKMVSEYKHKVRKIKHKIKEEQEKSL